MKKKKPKVKKSPKLVECYDCGGTGEVQAVCQVCNKGLTESSVEPGTDDLCRACAKEEDDYVEGSYQ